MAKDTNPLKNFALTVRRHDFVNYKKQRYEVVSITTEQLSQFLSLYAEEYTYQAETTHPESGPNPHFQGRCRLKVKKRQSTLLNHFIEFFAENLKDKRADHKAIGALANFKPEHHKDASEFYCLKVDDSTEPGTQVIYPVPEPTYDGSDLFIGEFLPIKYQWQIRCEEIIEAIVFRQPPPLGTILSGWQRCIPVIQDLEGSHGKTIFCKRQQFANPKDTVYIPVVDTPGQIMGALAKSGVNYKRIFLDVPRDLPYNDVRKVFMLAELIKSGIFVSTFYASFTSRLQQPPAVVIFTNREFFKNEIDSWAPANRFEFYTIDSKGGNLDIKFDFEYKKNEETKPVEEEKRDEKKENVPPVDFSRAMYVPSPTRPPGHAHPSQHMD